jgi:hypothetical protein
VALTGRDFPNWENFQSEGRRIDQAVSLRFGQLPPMLAVFPGGSRG